ncbi:MAG: hypothetical protein LBI20_00340 [Holosporales bacterium]|jgi:predicted component of type VI protein secretion system|nr:hypothetical protein [Holosporales bacterium]
MKVDRLFLEKFSEDSIYLKSESEFAQSIANEIGNILSCRLGITNHFKDFPFAYGTKDLESINISSTDLDEFTSICRESILHFESRLKDIEITDIKINGETQTISLEIVCYPKPQGFHKFTTNVTG